MSISQTFPGVGDITVSSIEAEAWKRQERRPGNRMPWRIDPVGTNSLKQKESVKKDAHDDEGQKMGSSGQGSVGENS